MKFKIACIAAFVAVLGLSACGGGGADSNNNSSGSAEVTALIIDETQSGSGPGAVAGNTVSVRYTGYLYYNGVGQRKGLQFDTNLAAATPYTFRLGAGEVIRGWDQGLVGAKVGSERTLTIPASLAYGDAGRGAIPPRAALIFDIRVVAIN